MAVLKRLIILLVLVTAPFALGLLLTYDLVKIDWISFMEIQNSFNPQEAPLPVPARSVPIQGVAYIAELGAPVNPVEANDESVQRGKVQYEINCSLCHGPRADGRGPFVAFLANKPASLLEGAPANLSDGEIFMTISTGVEGRMPDLRENLPDPLMRWDVVNYVRFLQSSAPSE